MTERKREKNPWLYHHLPERRKWLQDRLEMNEGNVVTIALIEISDDVKSALQTGEVIASHKKYTPDNCCFITMDRIPVSAHRFGPAINLVELQP